MTAELNCCMTGHAMDNNLGKGKNICIVHDAVLDLYGET